MRRPDVSEDLIPIGEFKTHASQLLRRLHENQRPMVITQHGRAAAVVITPEEFEALGYREFVKSKVAAGLRRAAEEGAVPSKDVRSRLKAKVRAPRAAPDAGR